GRVHQQFNTSSVDGEAASAFLIRRARPELDVVINDFVEGKLSADFGEGELDLKDAYVRLNFEPALVVTLGQFKRPFDLFELTSSTQILVIERAGGIRGATVTSLSRFTERLGYSDRDIGVQIAGRDRARRFQWMAAVTNGNGANTEDDDGVKAVQARLGVTPIPDLTLWAGVSSTPYGTDTTVAAADADHEQAIAFQVDAEWGNFSRGLHVQAGVTVGDNWAPVLGDVAEAPQFLAWQVIGAYKVPVTGSRYLQAWEPVFRLSRGDPETDVDDDGGWLITPGFVLHFAGRNKLAFNYDLWSPQAAGLDTEGSFKAQAYLHF
ncbi:MAG: porin, partial [Gemmatimonadota bacterium]